MTVKVLSTNVFESSCCRACVISMFVLNTLLFFHNNLIRGNVIIVLSANRHLTSSLREQWLPSLSFVPSLCKLTQDAQLLVVVTVV